jgi:hypothetical protein
LRHGASSFWQVGGEAATAAYVNSMCMVCSYTQVIFVRIMHLTNSEHHENESATESHDLAGAPESFKPFGWDVVLDRLGRAAFEEQERMLPEGEKWADLDEGEKAFWRLTAHAVVFEMRRIVEESKSALPLFL